jgi:FlgD Ig-like domain
MSPVFLKKHAVAALTLVTAVFIALPGVATTVGAASVCIPGAIGVPGEPGPPEWWGVVTGRKDDPRWCGSMGVGHAMDRGRFRALYAQEGGADYLYLNWEIRGDAGGIGQEFIHFGFVDPVSTTGHAFRIAIPTPTATPTDRAPIVPGQVQWRKKLATGVVWSAPQVTDAFTAPWFQDTGRYWVSCSGNCDSFTVQLRIPIDSTATLLDISGGLPLPDNFLFWYDMMVTPNGAPPITVHHTFPEGHPFSVGNFTNPAYPSASDWAETKIMSAVDCSPGVTLSESQIFVTHGAPAEQTHTVTTENRFHAAPTNDTGGPLAGDAVTARFRIANWDQGAANATWDLMPSCGTATGSGNVTDGADFDLTCTWDPDMNALCDYRPAGSPGTLPPWDVCIGPGTKSKDQWVVVDLSAGPGGSSDVFFAVASASRDLYILVDPTATAVNESPVLRPVLYQNVPNPFNPRTEIRFDILEPGHVTLQIYDVTGRLVRTIVDGERPSGSYRVDWDGRNGRGASMASGVYVYRLITRGFSTTKRTVLLK